MSWLDSAYFQVKFIIKLAEIEKYKLFLKENKQDFDKCQKGYLYLIETSINSLINSIEFLIEDQKLYKLIQWGDITTEQLIKEVKIKNKDIQFIHNLEGLRDKLKSIRFDKSKKDPAEYLILLINKCEEVLDYYLKNLRYTVVDKNKEKEDLFLLFNILNKQNYIEGELNFDIENHEKEVKVVSYYPAGSWYYLMNSKTYSAYHLQNPKIKQYEKEYVNGYKFGLAFFYKSINITKPFLNILINSKSWEDIHHVCAMIADRLLKDKSTKFIGESIFNLEYRMKSKTIGLKKITEPKQLIYVLGNRGIKVQNQDKSDNPFERHFSSEPILYSLIKSNINTEDKTEVIEFSVKNKNGDKKYSYAVYVFYGGIIWNGSYWLLFKDIAIENKFEKKSDIKFLIRETIKKFKSSFEFQKYEVDEKVFERYIRENDYDYRRDIKESNRIKDSNSLLNELITFYYHLKNLNKKIIRLDWGVELSKNNNEIDSLIVTEDEVIITQAKISLNKPVKKIKSHFLSINKLLPEYLANKNIIMNDKKIRNVLFLFRKELFPEQQQELENAKNEFEVVFFEDVIEKNKEFIPERLVNKIYSCMKVEWEYEEEY